MSIFTSDPPAIDPRLLETGGPLALSIDGLSGDAADAQDAKLHESTHQSGGSDVIDAQTLANFAHEQTHRSGGTDELVVEQLQTAASSSEFLSVNASGNLEFATPEAGVTEADLDARYDGFFPAVLG